MLCAACACEKSFLEAVCVPASYQNLASFCSLSESVVLLSKERRRGISARRERNMLLLYQNKQDKSRQQRQWCRDEPTTAAGPGQHCSNQAAFGKRCHFHPCKKSDVSMECQLERMQEEDKRSRSFLYLTRFEWPFFRY